MQVVEANRTQSYRYAAQKELANWIRFSSKDAEKYCDGLTAASMEINGLPGWVVRNFYGKVAVMKNNFREKNIGTVKEQVAQSAGWLIITSKDNSVIELLEAGKLPFANTIFKTQPLSWIEMLICLGASFIVFIAVEIEKLVKRKKD